METQPAYGSSLRTRDLLELVTPHLDTLFVLRVFQYVCRDTHAFIHSQYSDPTLWLHFCLRDYHASLSFLSSGSETHGPSYFRQTWQGLYLWRIFSNAKDETKLPAELGSLDVLVHKTEKSGDEDKPGRKPRKAHLFVPERVRQESFERKYPQYAMKGVIELIEEYGIGLKVGGVPIVFTIPNNWDGSLIKYFFLINCPRASAELKVAALDKDKNEDSMLGDNNNKEDSDPRMPFERELEHLRGFFNNGAVDARVPLSDQLAPLLQLFAPGNYTVELREIDEVDTRRCVLEMFRPGSKSRNDAVDDEEDEEGEGEGREAGGEGGEQDSGDNSKKTKKRGPPLFDSVQEYPATLLTQPVCCGEANEERIEHYRALLCDSVALRPIIFFVEVRGDYYLLDGHHKWLALKSFAFTREELKTELSNSFLETGAFLVNHKKYPNLRTPLALVVSLLHDKTPLRHRDLYRSPYTNWCSAIVDPQRQLSERERGMFGSNLPERIKAGWTKTLNENFSHWQTLCNPIVPTGKVVRLRVSNLARDVKVEDIRQAFHAECEVISVSEIIDCTGKDATSTIIKRLEEIIQKAENYEHEEDRVSLTCTVELTGEDVTLRQPLFECKCFSGPGEYICVSCANSCHQYHDITPVPDSDSGFCHCSMKKCCGLLDFKKTKRCIANKKRMEYEGYCIVEIDEVFLEEAMALDRKRLDLDEIRKYGTLEYSRADSKSPWRKLDIKRLDE